MSALGNGSVSGFQFVNDKVLQIPPVTSTNPVPNQYQSNLVGGRKRRSHSRSRKTLRSLRSPHYKELFTYKFHAGKNSRRKKRNMKSKSYKLW